MDDRYHGILRNITVDDEVSIPVSEWRSRWWLHSPNYLYSLGAWSVLIGLVFLVAFAILVLVIEGNWLAPLVIIPFVYLGANVWWRVVWKYGR